MRGALAAGLVAALLAGCASLPAQQLATRDGYARTALDPARIAVVSWNIKKGQAGNWQPGLDGDRLRRRLLSSDILLFQEACTDPPRLAPLLAGHGYGWRFAVSFVSATLGCGAEAATGVFTASRAAPVDATALRSRAREFGITPKTALATTFALRGRDARLLVVNAHLLNFELIGADAFAGQLERIAALIRAHDGPVILAGDFNTRTERRTELLAEAATDLRLESVFGAALAGRTEGWFGAGLALDHVYYRGLSVLPGARVGDEAERGVSDHNSLRVTFRVPGKTTQARE